MSLHNPNLTGEQYRQSATSCDDRFLSLAFENGGTMIFTNPMKHHAAHISKGAIKLEPKCFVLLAGAG
ncbi:hypothetical protein E4H12_10845 [Candidatus Thorarchaeota archaeon]|nr:MAG: hypothetical protein E4H12_10845 [Candidatus Thorarchaeota archaeon]